MAALTNATCVAVVVAAVLVAAVAPPAEAALACNTVLQYLQPCVPYVTNRGTLGTCCGGVRSLNAAARTTADRQSVCSCLKILATSSRHGINFGRAAGLPRTCGVNIPYKISTSIDCRKIR